MKTNKLKTVAAVVAANCPASKPGCLRKSNSSKPKQANDNMKIKIKFSGELTGTAGSNPQIHRDMPSSLDRGYQRLAAAVVIQAVEDYRRFEKRKLVKRGHITLRRGRIQRHIIEILDLIKFLRGRGLGLLLELSVFSLEQEMLMQGWGSTFTRCSHEA